MPWAKNNTYAVGRKWRTAPPSQGILGGYWLTPNGYVVLCKDRQNRPILEHRLVMEKILGRPLRDDEIVHHKDGNKQHNDPSNLTITNRSKHQSHHNRIGPLRGRAAGKVKK